MRGRATLLSVDVRTTEERLDGVRVYAVLGGRTVETDRRWPLRRDPGVDGGQAREEVWRGRSTCNFLLPAQTSAEVPLEVYLDATRVNGYDADVTPVAPERIRQTTLRHNLDPPDSGPSRASGMAPRAGC